MKKFFYCACLFIAGCGSSAPLPYDSANLNPGQPTGDITTMAVRACPEQTAKEVTTEKASPQKCHGKAIAK